jgi:protein-arginine kinase
MKRGFKETVDKILRSYGLLTTSDCIGAVWADGDWSWLTLNAMGYRVEKGISNPPYDYVIMSKGKSTLPNILQALTKIKTGTIIIFRAENLELMDLENLAKLTGSSFSCYEYENYKKILGVIFKGKDI